MGRKRLALLVVVALTLSACGAGGFDGRDSDAPILQVRSEGGFAPVEFILGQGPTFTLLGDGRLISEGPVVAIYPGPLLPNYLVSQVDDDDIDRIFELVSEIGLPEMAYEIDDSATRTVADANTEVVSYWDENGLHQYAVYALGIEPNPANPSSAAFAELLVVLDQARAKGDSVPYDPERVRVLTGVAMRVIDPEFEDIRQWPLEDQDPADWEELELGWRCKVFGPDVLETFATATDATEWLHPNPMMDAPTFAMLVRPLHAGEEDCEIPSPHATG